MDGIAAAAIGLLLAAAAPAEAQSLGGFLQVDYRHSQESADELSDGEGAPLNRDRFLVRRARLRAAGSSGHLAYSLEADFNTVEGAQVGLRETAAFLVGAAPESWNLGADVTGRIGAGLLRSPFGYETYVQRDVERLFADRALVSRALFPGEFDLGARGSIDAGFASLVLAVQNGEPIGSRPFPARDPNAAKDVIGRLEVRGALGPIDVAGGFAAAWGRGFHPGTPPTKDSLEWRDLNEDGIVQLGELQEIPGSAGTPSESFGRWGAEVDFRLGFDVPAIGRFSLYGEGALATNLDRGVRPADPVLLGRDQRSVGGYVALTQDVRSRVIVGMRLEHYRPEIDSTDLEGGEIVRSKESFTSISAAAGLPIAFSDLRGRLLVDFTHRRDPLARDATGRPSDLANDTLTARMEVVF